MRWDLLLLFRHGMAGVSLGLAVVYGLVLYYFRDAVTEEVIVLLVFSDPVMMGFIFIGAIVLLEKDAGTFQALIVNPLKTWQYLISKAICLTFLALPVVFAIMAVSVAPVGNLFSLIAGVLLTSVFFVFIGFSGAARVSTFNQYIIVVPVLLLPLCLPLLTLVMGRHSFLWYLVPTQAALDLMLRSFGPIQGIPTILLTAYLSLWILAAYIIAEYSFNKYIKLKP